MASNPFAQADHPYYRDPDQLLVTRRDQIVASLPCQRIHLPRQERWPTHHIGAHISCSQEGQLQAMVAGNAAVMHWTSADQGRTWNGVEQGLDGVGAFVVLDNGDFIGATGGGNNPVRILRSQDRGRQWTDIAAIRPDPFDALHIDSNLLRLQDQTLLLALSMHLVPPPGGELGQGYGAQYLYRSQDGGHTWSSGIDADFWRAVKAGKAHIPQDGPHCTWPGEGGTFPGVYETGFCQLADGRLMGAFRFSGPPLPWHHQVIDQWGERPEQADGHGRLFRHVVLGESADAGRTWENLRPVLDAAGAPLMLHGESNGELVELPDGRLVLVHQTRYAEGPDRDRGLFRGRSQLCARVSLDRGRTFLPERYRLLFGFGYSSTLALGDNSLVTVTGCALGDNGDPRRAAAISWQLAETL
ncbi:MAG: hypothetical protein GKR89_33715 [Candidatus Latescibacteria bacterium]|nr:hypothetical protein [Candidatus Latescibacterota bacterium]